MNSSLWSLQENKSKNWFKGKSEGNPSIIYLLGAKTQFPVEFALNGFVEKRQYQTKHRWIISQKGMAGCQQLSCQNLPVDLGFSGHDGPRLMAWRFTTTRQGRETCTACRLQKTFEVQRYKWQIRQWNCAMRAQMHITIYKKCISLLLIRF